MPSGDPFFVFFSKVLGKISDTNSVNQNCPRKGDAYMRINAYTQVQQVYGTKKAANVKSKGNVNFSDQLQISSIGKDIQSAKQAVAGASDVREDVTAPIKAKIQAGTYEVSAENFADRLMQKYEEMR